MVLYDAIIIGGGFYGTAIACELTTRRGFARVALLEREQKLLTRSSYNNQARIHNGYHYPRSFTTAYRSRVNLPSFVRDYPDAVKRDFTKLYAIARRNSNVTAKQFVRFCQDIGAKLEPAPQALSTMFEPRLIEAVFLAQEYVFDASVLAVQAAAELNRAGVEVRFGAHVNSIRAESSRLAVDCAQTVTGISETLTARTVFNCTYSGLNQFSGDFPGAQTRLKQEITEMALMEPPATLAGLGVTVMDGPFFSMMPFPPRKLHTLSHVRYTPHLHWLDQPGIDPYQRLENYECATRVDRMVRDVARYLPAVLDARYVDSLFEVKTVLVKNEGDDGRPILFEKHPELPGCYSILGGKIDNIYDILEKMNNE